MSNMLGVVIGLASLCVTLLGALILTVWRGASLVTELKTAVESLKEGMRAVNTGLIALADIPVLKKQVEQLEEAWGHVRSDIKELRGQVTSTREKVASIHDA